MQFIDLKTPSKLTEERVIARFREIMERSSYIMGAEIVELEHELATFVGVNHALAVSSGTDALLIALMALGVGRGDEVITSPFSFFATAETISLLGAKPVFIDIDPDTYNMDPSFLAEAITSRTKAIIPVSLYGQCADFDEIIEIAQSYQLPVIEDGAQSFGAIYKGRRSCGLTTIGCTSFFPSKPLGCYGDGGACFTNDSELAIRMHEIRTHGQSKRYYHTRLGINGRMDTIQAAVLLEKLALFRGELKTRQQIADRYSQLLPDHIKKPKILPFNSSVFAQYTIEVDNRNVVQEELKKQGIPTAVHYPLGLHEQPIFKMLYSNSASYPRSEYAARHVLSIPMHPYLTEAEQVKVSEALIDIMSIKTV